MSEVENTVAVEGKKSRKGKKNVTNVQFAKVWEKYAALARAGKCDKPITEIAKELGLEESSVKQRSSTMRNPKNGAPAIALSKLPKGGGGRKSDANATVDLLAQIQAEAEAAAKAEAEVEAEGESVEVEATEEVEEVAV